MPSLSRWALAVLLPVAYFLLSFGKSLPEREGSFSLEDGSKGQMKRFSGASKWTFVGHLFDSVEINVTCPRANDFEVYVGSNAEEAQEALERKEKAWCGWDKVFDRQKDTCILSVTPFETVYVYVLKPKGWMPKRIVNGDATNVECTMVRSERLSLFRMLFALLGVLTFFAAPYLAVSLPFRLAGGSLGFTLLSTVFILVLLYRAVPHKKTFVAASAVCGTTLFALIRLTFGVWIPNAYQMLRNPLVLSYWVLSALIGLGLTYYYNDLSDVKINNMLRFSIQIVSLIMIFGAISSKEAGLAIILIFLSVLLGRSVGKSIRRRSKGGTMQEAAEEHTPEKATSRDNNIDSENQSVGKTPRTPMSENKRLDEISHLVRLGKVLNVETGRVISIGKGRYNELESAGYTVDLTAGTITPPPEKTRTAHDQGSSSASHRSHAARRRRLS